MELNLDSVLDTVIEGDCLEVMPRLPAGSVNLILCDLPYGTTQNKWDSVIDLDALWAEYLRLLAPGGTIVLTSQGLFTAQLMLSRPKLFKYKIVWVKSKATNFLNAKRQPLRKHEDVLVFAKGPGAYYPQMWEGAAYDKGVRKEQLTGSYGDFDPTHVKSAGTRYPADVIYFKTAESESEGTVWHSTQKPVQLGRYLVRSYSKPGDVVLDNTSGVGSFLVASALEGRRFIGIELNDEHQLFRGEPIDMIEITNQRLAAARELIAADAVPELDFAHNLRAVKA